MELDAKFNPKKQIVYQYIINKNKERLREEEEALKS